MDTVELLAIEIKPMLSLRNRIFILKVWSNEPDGKKLMLLHISQSVSDFVDTHLDSFLKWELIRFFHSNDHVADTASQIANQLKRNVQVVQSALQSLAQTGIVHRVHFEDIEIYTLTEDDKLRHILEQFMQTSQERHAYLQIMYAIMRRIR